MERYTAFIEVTPYSWLTLVALCLGAVGALASIRAEKRRYPAIFRRRRTLSVLLLLLVAAISLPLSLFFPGPERFPPIGELLLFLIPLTLIWAALVRYYYVGIPLTAVAVGLLVWAESVATGEFIFPEEGRAIAFVDVREVEEERIDLFVELPPMAGRRLLQESLDTTFPLTLLSDELALLGREVRLHPYLWWRYPGRGIRVEEFQGAPALPEPFLPISEEGERVLTLLEGLGVAGRTEWRAGLPAEELLLSRYELRLEEQGILLRRSEAQRE